RRQRSLPTRLALSWPDLRLESAPGSVAGPRGPWPRVERDSPYTSPPPRPARRSVVRGMTVLLDSAVLSAPLRPSGCRHVHTRPRARRRLPPLATRLRRGRRAVAIVEALAPGRTERPPDAGRAERQRVEPHAHGVVDGVGDGRDRRVER